MGEGYAVQVRSSLEFAFTTLEGVGYRVWFKPTGYLFGEVAWAEWCYELVVQPEEVPEMQGTAGPDRRVPLTVAIILLQFFEQRDRTVLYTCETADGRGAARARKFDGWFRQFNDERFVKVDRHLRDPRLSLTYHNSIILWADHPFRTEILAAFEALFGDLESEK
jgi:hypothetical protein